MAVSEGSVQGGKGHVWGHRARAGFAAGGDRADVCDRKVLSERPNEKGPSGRCRSGWAGGRW